MVEEQFHKENFQILNNGFQSSIFKNLRQNHQNLFKISFLKLQNRKFFFVSNFFRIRFSPEPVKPDGKSVGKPPKSPKSTKNVMLKKNLKSEKLKSHKEITKIDAKWCSETH